MPRWAGLSAGSWVLVVEHAGIRVISLGCSFMAAYSIHLVLAPLGDVDFGLYITGWVIALCCGFGGYIGPRSVVYRVMRKETVAWLVPLVALVEFADLGSNCMLAMMAVNKTSMLKGFVSTQYVVLIVILYGLLMVAPLMGLCLAAADMALERKKNEEGSGGVGKSTSPSVGKPASPPPGPSALTWARGTAPAPGPSTPPARPGTLDNAGQGAGVPRLGANAGDAAARRGALINSQRQQGQPGQKSKQNGQGSPENLLNDLEEMPALS